MPLPPGFTEIQSAAVPPSSGGLPAGFSEDSQGPDYGQIVKDALNEARMGNGSKMRALLTDPVTQAKALPYLAGTGLSVLGVPGGMTAGTVGGRQVSNAALRSYGMPEEVPSTGDQIKEGVLSAAGDLTAIPAINRKVFGSQIGAAEARAGVPPPQDIPSTPMAIGQKSIGDFINEAVDSVKSSGLEGTPTYWKQIKDQVDRIYKMGKDQALTGLDKGRLAWLNQMTQAGLNKAVPGRAIPAAALARSQAIPNAIKEVSRTAPWWLKGAVATGVTAAGADTLGRALLGK